MSFAIVGLALVSLFGMVGGVRVEPRPISLVALTSLGSAMIAIAAVTIALPRGRWLLGRPRLFLLACLMFLPLALLLWKVFVTLPFTNMSVSWPTRPGWRCFRLSFLFAAPPLIALLWTLRSSDPVHPRTLGAFLGAAAGACAAILVDLWCPVAYVPHLLLGHLLPIVALAALGAMVGDRVLGIHPRKRSK